VIDLTTKGINQLNSMQGKKD